MLNDRPINLPLASLRVLLIEDYEDNRMLYKNVLQHAGAEVDTAKDGLEGVARASSAHYDLILMDIQMPNMDGYEATRILRQQGCSKPIVALTAHAMLEERQRCLDGGFTDYIATPVGRDELIQCLQRLS